MSQEFLGCMMAPTSPANAAGAGASVGAFFGGGQGLADGLITRDVEWLPVRAEGARVDLAPLPAGHPGLGAAVGF